MRLISLGLENFRNFSKKEFIFGPGLNVVVGRNTIGKTNLLEAIGLLATGGSFRGAKNNQLVRQNGGEVTRVRGKFSAGGQEEGLEILFQRMGEVPLLKRFLVNGVPRRRVDFIGQLRAVVFRPEDLDLVAGSPNVRREFLDAVLTSVDQDYLRALHSYQKGLRQRNRLLEQIREEGAPRSGLFFWDRLLIENGQRLSSERTEFVNYLNQQPDYFGDLVIDYDQSVISPERLRQYERQEVAAGMTLVGPHRDDLKILMMAKNGDKKTRDLADFGSRGEQRLAVFSLKLAQLEFVALRSGSRPLLLLDDIFSELDEENRKHLVTVIPKQQTFLTTTGLDFNQGILAVKAQRINL